MEFELDLYDKIQIHQINREEGRHYEVDGDANKYTSVTSFLSKTSVDSSGLFEWRYNVGEEEADRISKASLERGTSIHKMFEDYILFGILPDSDNPFFDNFWPIKILLDKYLTCVKGVELPLFSKLLMLAGTTDLVGFYKEKLSIIDFKGSNKPKSLQYIESYILQTLIYALMVEDLYKDKVEQLVILISVDNLDKAQQIIIPRKSWKPYLTILSRKIKRYKEIHETNTSRKAQ